MWGNTDLKYSDWRKERFSEVQILDADYFDVEKLTAWFGYDRSSAEIEDVKQVVSEIPATPPAPEAEEVAQEPTARQPATEKPDEVKTPDTTEEPVEQSSNWLWLIGLLVVVGGLAVVVGRKS